MSILFQGYNNLLNIFNSKSWNEVKGQLAAEFDETWIYKIKKKVQVYLQGMDSWTVDKQTDECTDTGHTSCTFNTLFKVGEESQKDIQIFIKGQNILSTYKKHMQDCLD